MAITGISAIGDQQIIAAGAQSATKAYQDSNGGVITSKYQTTANMSNYQTTAGMSDYVAQSSTIVNIGYDNTAKNDFDLIQGRYNSASGYSLTQGGSNSAKNYSLAQGSHDIASSRSLAQGWCNEAVDDSLAQGIFNDASSYSVAQGSENSASGTSLAQGQHNQAFVYSMCQGYSNSAYRYSQAFGLNNIISGSGMAIGAYNKTSADASFVIGNGTAADARSDIFVIDHNGNVSAAGKISANGVELGPGGAGVVTSTAGDGTYVTAINETPLSGAGGIQVVTSIHTAEYGVMAGTSATAVDKINGMGLFAQSGWSAVNAGWAKSADSAYKDGNGRVIANTYQTTDGMTAYPDSADVTGTAQYGLTTAGWTEITAGGGAAYTGNVQEALDEVYSSSGNWNSVYNHVSTASASWTGGGGGGITEVTLWEASDSGQKSGVFELSDSLTNYKRYGIYYNLAGYRNCFAAGYSELVYRPDWSGFTLEGNKNRVYNDGDWYIFNGYSYGSATTTSINILSAVTITARKDYPGATAGVYTSKSAGLAITKIVGIN